MAIVNRRNRQFSQAMSPHIETYFDEYRKTRLTTVDDPTRVYEHGVIVRVGLEDIGQVFGGTKLIGAMRDWCSQALGAKEYGAFYADRWQVSNKTFWFKTEADRTMFMLRWS